MMSSEEVRKVSLQDIQLVQNLIERCLQLYMSQREVVSTLLQQAKIEPGFTELVWQKLEAENQEFFRAYHLRLIVKEQINRFNQLLAKQVELMRQISQNEFVSIPMSNGSQHSLHNNLAYQGPQQAVPYIKPEDMHQTTISIPSAYTNGTFSMQPFSQIGVNMPSQHSGPMDVPQNMLYGQNSNLRMMQGMNGNGIKAEEGYAGDTSMMFGADNNLLEARNEFGEASMSPFNGGESSSQAVGESILDPDTNSFGFLGQIPRNFSLSDLTADFSNSTDILESYSRSPFLGTDANFLDPNVRGDQQDTRRLDTITEGFSYDDFSSD